MKILAFGTLWALFCGFNADLCQHNFTISDFPKGVVQEGLSLLIKGNVESFTGCPTTTTISPDKINFRLWNEDHPNIPALLDQNNPRLNPKLPTILLVPGWLCNLTNDLMPQLKDAYLQRFSKKANIIGLDWSTYSISLYSDAFCFAPSVAKLAGSFICKLSTLGVDLNQMHMVGHSMGGQIAGLIGQEIQEQCKKVIGRITALDPAGPLYQTVSEERKLDGGDAEMVEVIHTNQGQFGYYGV